MISEKHVITDIHLFAYKLIWKIPGKIDVNLSVETNIIYRAEGVGGGGWWVGGGEAYQFFYFFPTPPSPPPGAY